MPDWSSPLYIPAHASRNYPEEWYVSKSDEYDPVEGKIISNKIVYGTVILTEQWNQKNISKMGLNRKTGRVKGTF